MNVSKFCTSEIVIDTTGRTTSDAGAIMRSILVFAVLFVLCDTVSAREWKDAKGRHSIQADFVDAKVTLRLANGQTRVVDMKMLSAADQQYILKTLGENNAPPNNQPPPKELAQLIDDLEAALDDDDTTKIIAATKAIQLADPTCKDVQPIVQQLVSGRNSDETAILILCEVGADAVWAADHLLSIDEGLNTDGFQIHPDRTYGLNILDPKSLAIERDRLNSRRELIRALADFYKRDQRVKQLFDKRMAQLRSAPNPEDRARAAYRLSRAMAISSNVIPELENAAKEDAAITVRIAAMHSLGGFGIAAKQAIPIIVDAYQAIDDADIRFNLLLSLAAIQSDNPQMRKVVTKVLEDYKRGRADYNLVPSPACKMLEAIQTKGAWAIPKLLEAAEFGLAKKRSDFMVISETLASVGAGDARVLKFYEIAAKNGPEEYRVHCDTAAKRLRMQMKP